MPVLRNARRPPLVCAVHARLAQNYAEVDYRSGDVFLFGPETRGLPQATLDALPAEQRLRIPMRPDNRSLNLANSAAIVLYEAWRQQGFAGGSLVTAVVFADCICASYAAPLAGRRRRGVSEIEPADGARIVSNVCHRNVSRYCCRYIAAALL